LFIVVVVRHALFPLLALLFERCEQVTHAPDCTALTTLKADIQLFVQHQQQRDGGKFTSDDPEVDSLVSALSYSLFTLHYWKVTSQMILFPNY